MLLGQFGAAAEYAALAFVFAAHAAKIGGEADAARSFVVLGESDTVTEAVPRSSRVAWTDGTSQAQATEAPAERLSPL